MSMHCLPMPNKKDVRLKCVNFYPNHAALGNALFRKCVDPDQFASEKPVA